MLVINLHKWLCMAIFAWLLWLFLPALADLVAFVVLRPGALWFIAGLATGAIIAGSLGWNAALALRRDQAIERARQDYDKDKRRIV
jgi:hypothetical protein